MKPAVHHGIFNLSAADYHAGATDTPSLSASIIHTLCTRSPLHAWTQHPGLNPDFERKEEERFDLGTAAHSMLLQGEDIAFVVHADSWRTNDAKEAREEARAAGRIPMLAKDYQRAMKMVLAVGGRLGELDVDPPLFADGQPEATLVWEEGDVLCRARLDWLRDDHTALDDLKSTSRSAHPERYARSLFDVGGDIQAAFYLRGLRALTGAEAQFRWVVVETAPPFALSVVSPGPDVLTLADAKIDYALELWAECLRTDEWPGYPQRVATAELPPWEETRWLEREALSEEAAA